MAKTRHFLLAGLAAITAALSYLPYRQDLRRAQSTSRHGSRVIDTDAGRIEYADEGGGFPLLSIHGAGGGHDQGLANVSPFAGHEFRVISPSRFGYLRTPVP